MAWMIEIDGLVVDARRLPLAIQEVAFQKGIIPYVVPPNAGSENEQATSRHLDGVLKQHGNPRREFRQPVWDPGRKLPADKGAP